MVMFAKKGSNQKLQFIRVEYFIYSKVKFNLYQLINKNFKEFPSISKVEF